MSLKNKHAGFQQITRSRTIEGGVRDAAELAGIASALLEPLFPVEKGIRLLDVILSSLEPQREDGEEEQFSLGLPGL